MNCAGKIYKIEKRHQIKYTTQNNHEIANVLIKKILIPADIKPRSKHGHIFSICPYMKTNILPTNHGIVCQKR